MDRFELQKLRDLPIEGVAERLGLQVSRHKCLCPFHDDTHPSLSFSVRKNTFRCFVCDAHGGTIDLAMKLLGKDFKEACRWLADEHNVILEETKILRPFDKLRTGEAQDGLKTILRPAQEPTKTKPFDATRYARFFERPFINQAARKFLFEERMLDKRVVNWCKLTSWRDRNGVDWLQIPYFDIDGKLIGIQNRNLDYQKASPNGGGLEGASRFRFPYGSQCSIYNMNVLKMLRQGEELWITEGCSDCWAMLSSGHKAIAIPSATLLKPKELQTLSTLSSQLSTKFHMYPDNDVPGERLFLQLKEILPNLVRHQLPLGCKDFSDYYVQLKTNTNNEQQ